MRPLNAFYRNVGKRWMDVILAGAGILALSPVFLLTALLVRFTMGAPVLFRQERLGRHERAFTLMKFRTMTDATDRHGRPRPDRERLTRTGAFLRASSLDELPQLLNVLKGDMSLIGPRPLFVHYLPYYLPRERKRHNVRPGITGLAQVSGRNRLLWDDRLSLDAEYVERLSAKLDLVILLKTVRSLLTRGGVILVPGTAQGPLSEVREPRQLPDDTGNE